MARGRAPGRPSHVHAELGASRIVPWTDASPENNERPGIAFVLGSVELQGRVECRASEHRRAVSPGRVHGGRAGIQCIRLTKLSILTY